MLVHLRTHPVSICEVSSSLVPIFTRVWKEEMREILVSVLYKMYCSVQTEQKPVLWVASHSLKVLKIEFCT